MKYIIEHEKYGPVLFDTSSQTFQCIDPDDFKFMNGFRFFDTTIKFDLSPVKKAIVPLACLSVKQIKKRTLVVFMDWNNRLLNFYNVERIENKWVNNHIDPAISSKCYFAFIEKNKFAMNDYILIRISEIKKGLCDSTTTVP